MKRPKKEEQKTTINDILTEDTVKELIDSFVTKYMAHAQQIAIIWFDDKDMLHIRSCGLSNLERLGTLELAKDVILDEDSKEEE